MSDANGNTPKSVVLRIDELPAVERGGGVRTVHLVGAATGARAFTNGVTTFERGTEIPLHSHNCDESVVILSGEAVFEDETGSYDLVAGDTTLVPEGVVHRFRNRCDGPMSILWIYGSVTPTRTLAATGETYPITREMEAS
jgi:putative monooxygenase